MFGNLVNTGVIIIGSIIGIFFNGQIPEKYSQSIMKAIALGILLIGILNALEVQNMILVLISMTIGTILGELIQIENKLEGLGDNIKKNLNTSNDSIVKSFVTASLLFCVGSMAIIGSLESGLNNNHETLLAKSVLDGISSIIFSSSIGVGVIFSAIPVFLYQGAIILSASFLKPFLTELVIADMSAIGGLLIIGLGLNMLDYKKIKVGNMLPAIFIPLIYDIILNLIK
ncbi:MAG: DUF554 domain-containing protein [Bacillota bacterium]